MERRTKPKMRKEFPYDRKASRLITGFILSMLQSGPVSEMLETAHEDDEDRQKHTLQDGGDS